MCVNKIYGSGGHLGTMGGGIGGSKCFLHVANYLLNCCLFKFVTFPTL